MRFGLNFFPTCRPESKSASEYFAEALELTEAADLGGFESVKIVEHYGSRYGGYSPSPLIFLAAASQRTRRLRLVTGAVVPAFTHPVKLASELAMLDAISGGRLEAGFARAFLPHEFETFGVDIESSRARFEEGVTVVRRLWTEREVSHQGRFHQFSDVRLTPRPVQRPHPPIRVAAVATPESFAWAGNQGFGLMVVPYLSDYAALAENLAVYRRNYLEVTGRVAEPVAVTIHAFVADTEGEAHDLNRDLVEGHLRLTKESTSAWAQKRSPQYRGYEKLIEKVDSLSYGRMCEEARVLAGDATCVRQQIDELADFFGDVQLDLNVLYGEMSMATARENLDHLAAEVLPALHGSRLPPISSD